MILRRVAPLHFLALAACVPASTAQQSPAETAAPTASGTGEAQVLTTIEDQVHYGSRIALLPPRKALLSGEFEQGGWIRGTADANISSITADGEPILFDPKDKSFFVGIDRDAAKTLELAFTQVDGQTASQTVTIAPRQWDIERVNVAKRPSGSSEEWWAKREPEWLAIRDARAKETGAEGWKQQFIWPVTGRISGRFGRQRIYRGEPGSYHSGLDIAPGNGVPFVAPADGVVVLARTGFSLEGGIVILDHGAGLNSAFIHMSRLAVAEGDEVEQGQLLGNVGASGRATGPHLHWSLMWRDSRLDPLLFLPPMP